MLIAETAALAIPPLFVCADTGAATSTDNAAATAKAVLTLA
jgi:hypothetical protein